MIPLTWIGLLFNLSGVLLAAVALISRRRKYSREPLMPWWGAFKAWTSVKVLRRPRPTTSVKAKAAGAWAVAMNAEATVTLGEHAPLEEQIGYLRAQVQALDDKVKEEAQARRDAINEASSKLSDADAALDERIRAVDERTIDIAAGSTWLELWGLICVAVGSALVALPPLLGWS